MFGASPDYKDLISKGAIILDVRSKAEYNDGHIKDSKNIPLDQVRGSIQLLKEQGSPVITVCRSGTRSSIAADLLSTEGVEAYNGGAWTQLNERLKIDR